VGKSLPVGEVGWNHFMLFGDLFKVKDDGRVRYLIWLATTWNIWKHRNNIVFNGVLSEAKLVIDEIKISSWAWFSNRYGRKSCIPFFLLVY
jgi:hypothetical protein